MFLTQLAIKQPFNFPPHPVFIFALPWENKTNKILYFCPRKHYYLIKIRHKTHVFTIMSLGLIVHPTVRFSTAYSKKCSQYQSITWPQAQRWFLLSLTAVAMMFCSRPIQTSAVTFWIHQHFWRSSGWHSATWQSNLVIDWLLGTTGRKIQNLLKFFCSLQCTYRLFCFSQVVRKHTLGKVGTKTVFWWAVVSKIFAPKIIKIFLILL